MDTRDKLLSRLEAINTDSAELETRLRTNQSEAKEIESALRVINRYSEDSSGFLQQMDDAETSKVNLNITDAILEAITEAGDTGATSPDIKNHLKEKYEIDVKPSTLSVIIQRHKKNKKIVKNGNQWFPASL